jgi:Ycf66 protein N-terminus
MLAHILAVLVGTGSLGLYIAAFFFPEIHRKQDFIWSGVGFFYALSLWIYARQTTGGVLIGETASVALLGWFVWQTLKLRRQLVPTNQQTPIPSTSKIQQQLGLKPIANSKSTAPTKSKPTGSTPTKLVTPNPIDTPAKPTPVTVPVDRSQPKPPPVVPPTPSAPSVRVPVEVRVERKPPQPPAAVPTVPTPTQSPVVRATIPAPVAVPVEPKPQTPPTVATQFPTIPTAVVPAPAVVPVEPKPSPAPPPVPAAEPPEEEAWIKLEVKPSSPTPSKPIGQAAKPPTTMPTIPTQPAAIAAESVPRTAPTAPDSSPKSDPESSNN